MAPEHVPMVARYADVLQIGARNMQNYQLLQAVGDSGKPALLKRGMSATIDEFLLAAEYILDRGNPHVMLCERGIRTYEDHTRFTLPLATVPYLQDKSHLPVVVDPSHGTGKARLVDPDVQGRHRRRGRRPDHRGPRRPRARHERRLADDHPGRLRPADGGLPPRSPRPSTGRCEPGRGFRPAGTAEPPPRARSPLQAKQHDRGGPGTAVRGRGDVGQGGAQPGLVEFGDPGEVLGGVGQPGEIRGRSSAGVADVA